MTTVNHSSAPEGSKVISLLERPTPKKLKTRETTFGPLMNGYTLSSQTEQVDKVLELLQPITGLKVLLYQMEKTVLECLKVLEKNGKIATKDISEMWEVVR